MGRPKCTNCSSRMVKLFIRGYNEYDNVGYLCKECKSYFFIINVNKELNKLYYGLKEITKKEMVN